MVRRGRALEARLRPRGGGRQRQPPRTAGLRAETEAEVTRGHHTSEVTCEQKVLQAHLNLLRSQKRFMRACPPFLSRSEVYPIEIWFRMS